MRDASLTAEKLVLEADTEGLMNEDIAILDAAVFRNWSEGKEELNPQAEHLLKLKHGQFLRNGLGIKSVEERERYIGLVAEMNLLLAAAHKRLSEVDDGIWFSKDELPGVPSSVLDSMKHGPNESGGDNSSLFCTFHKGHYAPVMKQCTRGESRKKLYTAKDNRLQDNVERLRRLVELRHEVATLLGYENHAELKMEEKTSESFQSVTAQLKELRDKLQPIAGKEVERMLELKTSSAVELTTTQREIVDTDKLRFWD